MNRKRRLIWIGDFDCATGFERATRHTLAALFKAGWEIVVLALNYTGDYHGTPYFVYRASAAGDAFGVRRIAAMTVAGKPDVIIIQNDPWNIKCYTDEIRSVDKKVPIIATMAVDGLNIPGYELNELSLGLFWTHFGAREATACGFKGRTKVIPLGVDVELYVPRDRTEARACLETNEERSVNVADAFIVGNVNRNQPRKRLDLTVRYFSEWVKNYDVRDAYLYLHVCPTGDANGHDVRKLMQYYGLRNRLIVNEPHVGFGLPEAEVAMTYSMFDVQVNTGQGEGFGLTTLEGMSCGIPQIVSDWAAFHPEFGWPGPQSIKRIPCTSTSATLDIGVIGGVPDEAEFVKSLHDLYTWREKRTRLASRGLAWANRPEYRWESIGQRFVDAVESVVSSEEVRRVV